MIDTGHVGLWLVRCCHVESDPFQSEHAGASSPVGGGLFFVGDALIVFVVVPEAVGELVGEFFEEAGAEGVGAGLGGVDGVVFGVGDIDERWTRRGSMAGGFDFVDLAVGADVSLDIAEAFVDGDGVIEEFDVEDAVDGEVFTDLFFGEAEPVHGVVLPVEDFVVVEEFAGGDFFAELGGDEGGEFFAGGGEFVGGGLVGVDEDGDGLAVEAFVLGVDGVALDFFAVAEKLAAGEGEREEERDEEGAGDAGGSEHGDPRRMREGVMVAGNGPGVKRLIQKRGEPKTDEWPRKTRNRRNSDGFLKGLPKHLTKARRVVTIRPMMNGKKVLAVMNLGAVSGLGGAWSGRLRLGVPRRGRL